MTRARGLMVVACLILGGGSPALASVSSVPSTPSVARDDCRGASRGGADPLAKLRQADVALGAALRRHVPDWSPEAPIQAARIDRLLGEILDYETIARQALGPRWDALTAAQRAAFLGLFSPLTNRAFVSAAERRVTVSYDSEHVAGPEATVVADAPETRIEYKLDERCGHWRIYDVTVDGVSLVEGYRAQFDKLLRRGTFEDVLAIMRRKLRSTATP